MHEFAGLVIKGHGLWWSFLFPHADGLADDTIDGFGKGGARLVHRHVKKADALARGCGAGRADTDAAHAKPADLVLP
jgi:hypothetical protein